MGTAAQKYMTALQEHQEVLLNCADIIMEAYQMESAILRAKKIAAKNGEEAASRFYKASLLGPVRVYTEDETQRTIRARRKDSVVQKIWDHNVAKTKLAGLMEGVG